MSVPSQQDKPNGQSSATGLENSVDVPIGDVQARSYWATVWQRLKRDPVTIACAFILFLIVFAALLAPYLGLADPYRSSMINRLLPVGSPGHPLGTDELGRDMLSRLIHGGRLSLFMGVTPVIGALIIGGTLGLIAGYVGGKVNMAIMRVADVFYAFPSVLLAVAIAGAMGPGLTSILISITVVFIPPLTRVTESVTTQARNFDFVDAARASGARSWRIIVTHVFANVIGPVFIYATALVSLSIVIASGLSFLGLGAAPPAAEWGLMLNRLREAIYISPLVTLLPGVMIFISSMCFNLISDGLRSAMDVRL